MRQWMIFIQERIPFVGYILISIGLSASGIYLVKREFSTLPAVLSFIGILFFLFLLRLVDEIKNSERDRIAHPERPFARGLISRAEGVRLLNLFLMVMFAYCLMLWVILNDISALAYLVVTVYLWLIFQDFGMRSYLSKRPFLNALLIQAVVIPVALFAVAAASPTASFPLFKPLSFTLMLFGTFFTYEICSQLDPRVHPIMATYLHYHGFKRTFDVALVMIALSAMGAFALGIASLLFPCEIVVVGSLGVLFFQPSLFRIPQTISLVSLMLHVWAVALFHIFTQ